MGMRVAQCIAVPLPHHSSWCAEAPSDIFSPDAHAVAAIQVGFTGLSISPCAIPITPIGVAIVPQAVDINPIGVYITPLGVNVQPQVITRACQIPVLTFTLS